ncbi:MAG TPA: response regulator transcription factor [Terriglobales bacterium]
MNQQSPKSPATPKTAETGTASRPAWPLAAAHLYTKKQDSKEPTTSKLAKILIVDDDPDLRTALKLRLRANRFDTVNAVDAYSAITQAHKERPDLIILDLGLPAGDGFVVLDRLHRNAELAEIPVVVLTARDAESSESESLTAGACAFFQKPADNTQLLDTIRAILAHNSGGIPA